MIIFLLFSNNHRFIGAPSIIHRERERERVCVFVLESQRVCGRVGARERESEENTPKGIPKSSRLIEVLTREVNPLRHKAHIKISPLSLSPLSFWFFVFD